MRSVVTVLALVAATPLSTAGQAQAGSSELLQARVQSALRIAADGDFGTATDALLGILDWCEVPGSTPGFLTECRTLTNYSLGYVHQVQGSATRTTALFGQAVTYYDDVLRDDPDNADAIYNRTLALRALGAEEGQADWFREAAERDPSRAATYLSFLGDYYLYRDSPANAVRAYTEAIDADAKTEGARSGLVTALQRAGSSGRDELLAVADEWRFSDPAAASGAYDAVLEDVMAEPVPPEGEPHADEAIIQLVMLREHIGPPPFVAARSDLPGLVTWQPSLQLDAFLRSAVPDSAPWWTRNFERRRALATAALRRGVSAGADGMPEHAERFWRAGLDVAAPRSVEAVSLQSELALLYARHPRLDPDGVKFRAIEDRMFAEKGAVIVSGDLEATQRFHTTLGLIYVERGIWGSGRARNAVDQLSWAIQAADDREREEGFHQPLPGIRSALVDALERVGRTGDAARVSLDAVRAWLDVDEIQAATDAAGTARRLNPDSEMMSRLESLITVRTAIAARANVCAANPTEMTPGTGTPGFAMRQGFKMLVDCAGRVPQGSRYLLDAFALTQRDGFTLIGQRDVRRMDELVGTLLTAAGMSTSGGQIEDGEAQPGDIAVSLSSETVPLRYRLPPDQLLALRVLQTLGPERSDRIAVRGGVVTMSVNVPDALVRRVSALPGVIRVVRTDQSNDTSSSASASRTVTAPSMASGSPFATGGVATM